MTAAAGHSLNAFSAVDVYRYALHMRLSKWHGCTATSVDNAFCFGLSGLEGNEMFAS